MDLWVMKNKMQYDEAVVRNYLRQCSLEEFYDNILYVTDVWFGDKPHTSRSEKIEEYVLRGGVYGTLENHITVAQSKNSGKFKYALSRIFLPYKSLKNSYPILEKYKILFPFMQIKRWFDIMFSGRAKRGFQELRINSKISKEKVSEMGKFLEDIGL